MTNDISTNLAASNIAAFSPAYGNNNSTLKPGQHFLAQSIQEASQSSAETSDGLEKLAKDWGLKKPDRQILTIVRDLKSAQLSEVTAGFRGEFGSGYNQTGSLSIDSGPYKGKYTLDITYGVSAGTSKPSSIEVSARRESDGHEIELTVSRLDARSKPSQASILSGTHLSEFGSNVSINNQSIYQEFAQPLKDTLPLQAVEALASKNINKPSDRQAALAKVFTQLQDPATLKALGHEIQTILNADQQLMGEIALYNNPEKLPNTRNIKLSIGAALTSVLQKLDPAIDNIQPRDFGMSVLSNNEINIVFRNTREGLGFSLPADKASRSIQVPVNVQGEVEPLRPK